MADALLLLGPTASGKTATAIALAHRIPAEVISIDSALVYRGMDIGTAKPTLAEREGVPHHLIDIRDPADSYSAADFVADCRAKVLEIRARGRVPLIVGGTMLYAKALRDGLSKMPPTDPAVRERVLQEAGRLGWPAMHGKLAAVDPVTASRLKPADSQRIGRALEVWLACGKPLSSFHGVFEESGVETVACGLLPPDRAQLHEKIGLRFERMLVNGFLDEMRALMARGDLTPQMPSMRAVGYRQAWAYLAGQTDRATFVEAGKAATRHLAKHQMTWMRSMRDLTLADPADPLLMTCLLRTAESLLPH